MIDTEYELVEMFTTEDSETEKEDNKEEKLRTEFSHFDFDHSITVMLTMYSEEYSFLHHPEIPTPPPESL